MKHHRITIRNFEATNLLETFMISAVAAVLGIRFFLHITGYPQIGGGGLHIAHMLWGGLLMMIALIIAISFLSKASDTIAAIIGGFGFGTFIDEIGKFVTADNDYFFKPTASLIYIIFILILLSIRGIEKYRKYSDRERLMNALRELEEVISHDLDKEEKEKALKILSKCDSKNPLVQSLFELFNKIELVPVPPPNRFSKTTFFFRNLYNNIVNTKGFTLGLILFFIGQLLVKLLYAFFFVFLHGFHWTAILDIKFLGQINSKLINLSWIDWGQLGFSLISGIFVFLGVYRVRKHKLKAYQMFKRSILISIFFIQGFTFYKEEFSAILGLLFNIMILWALDFIIKREKIETSRKEIRNPKFEINSNIKN